MKRKKLTRPVLFAEDDREPGESCSPNDPSYPGQNSWGWMAFVPSVAKDRYILSFHLFLILPLSLPHVVLSTLGFLCNTVGGCA